MVETRQEKENNKKMDTKLTLISSDLESIRNTLTGLASNDSIDELKKLITEQNRVIQGLTERVNLQDNLISMLNDKVAILGNSVNILKGQQDNQEQYSRRYCLRITGLKKEENESADNCVEKVVKMCEDLNVNIIDKDIDRAHRIGKDKSSMIVKFHSFKKRTILYKSRKKEGPLRIYLDLTKRRLDLLDSCKGLINNDPM